MVMCMNYRAICDLLLSTHIIYDIYSETCLKQTFVFGIDRCSVYAD